MNSTRKVSGARVVRERETLETMVRLYCQCQHHARGLCAECRQVLEYSKGQLETCRLGNEKPLCEDCPYQCYLPATRKKLLAILETTRMRMLWQHPHMSLRHWFDSHYRVRASALRKNYASWGSE